MILFKCDVCGCDCPKKVISCQLTFGAKNISTNEVRSTQLCISRIYVKHVLKDYGRISAILRAIWPP